MTVGHAFAFVIAFGIFLLFGFPLWGCVVMGLIGVWQWDHLPGMPS